MDNLPRIALTCGEPAGIGVDITLQLAQQPLPAHLVVFADPQLLKQRAKQLHLPIELDLQDWRLPRLHQPGQLVVKSTLLSQPVVAGQLNQANATYVLETLRQAGEVCMRGHCDAIVTAPVHKGIINDAGIPFSGHTEFFADMTHTRHVVMMLATQHLRVALVTTHLPLAEVPNAITPQRLESVIRILYTDLQSKFGIPDPHILVCGLNPHAGEGGHLGQEEIRIIMPVMQRLRAAGMRLTGPVPADTAFTPHTLNGVDAVLSMFHDQGLPVLKREGFGQAVNITLGLPIIRTSVDHGTALELAGTGKAKGESLFYAVHTALELALRKRH